MARAAPFARWVMIMSNIRRPRSNPEAAKRPEPGGQREALRSGVTLDGAQGDEAE